MNKQNKHNQPLVQPRPQPMIGMKGMNFSELCQDEWYHILEFLETTFLLNVCMRVSKQFYKISIQVPKIITLPPSSNNERSMIDIIQSPHLKNITQLSCVLLSWSDESEKLMKYLPNGFENLKNLTRFQCMNCMNQEGAKYISENFWDLTELHLHGNHLFGDEGVRFVAESAVLTRLKILDLTTCNISQEGARWLSLSKNVKNLTQLHIMFNNIGDEGLKYIADSPYLSNLTSLKAIRTYIGDKGIMALSQSKNLSKLRFLSVMGNSIGNEGVKSLIDACGVNFPHIHTLHLGRNYITDEGAKYFLQNDYIFKNLLELNLSYTKIHEMEKIIPEKLVNLMVFYFGMNEMITRTKNK